MTGLRDEGGVEIEAALAEEAISADARGVHFAAAAGDVLLLLLEEERLDGHVLGPLAPVTDDGVDRLAGFRAVGVVRDAEHGLEVQQVDLPVAALLTDRGVDATEGVGGVAPLVVTDEATVEELEIVETVADGDRAGIALGVGRQHVLEIQLDVGTDRLELVDVAVVLDVVAVVTVRILDFYRESQRVDDVTDAEVEPRAVEERLVHAVGRTTDIVIAVFITETVVEAGIEPAILVEQAPRALGRRSDILGRIRVARGAIGQRLGVVGCRVVGGGEPAFGHGDGVGRLDGRRGRQQRGEREGGLGDLGVHLDNVMSDACC